MFQSSVTYYENWSIFWVMLSALCFVRVVLNRGNNIFWFLAFFVSGALAVSTHERMFGYYLFSAPFLIYKYYINSRGGKETRKNAVLLILAVLSAGLIVFCLANNIFREGFGPTLEYIRFKSSAIKPSQYHMAGLSGFLKGQVRCHAHTIWLVFWNLGAILPFFSLYGIIAIWKKRFYPALNLLLFPLGYQVLSVGLPGWTSGRYVLGQTIFAALFAGFAVMYLIAQAKSKNKAKLALVLFSTALLAELFVLSAVKIADVYYNPYRAAEEIVMDPASRGKKIAIQALAGLEEDMYWRNDVKSEFLDKTQRSCKGADIIISSGRGGCECAKITKEEFRKAPAWLVFLVKKQCYLYSQGLSDVRIQWCDNG